MADWVGRDGGIYKTLSERDAADARYSQNEQQIEELKKSNVLAEQRIQEEKENAKRIADATIQAERSRQAHEEQMELERQLHDLEMQQSKEEHENMMRYKKLCDEYGLVYEDLESFNNALRFGKISFSEIYDQKSLLEIKKDELKEISEKDFINNYDEGYKYFEDNDIKTYTISDLNDAINKEKDKIEETKNIKYLNIQPLVDLLLLCWVGYQGVVYFTCGDELNRLLLSISIFIVFNVICKMYVKMLIKRVIDQCNNKIEMLKKEKSRKSGLAKNEQKSKTKRINEEIKNLESSIKKAEQENYQYGQSLYSKFIEFRLNNYNDDFEILLRKLDLMNIENFDKEFIRKNKPIDELRRNDGDIKDYNKFLRNVLI